MCSYLLPSLCRGDRRAGPGQDRGLQAPKEAETVQLIFRRYLELGSIGVLSDDLDRRDHGSLGSHAKRSRQGILHSPSSKPQMKQETRDALLSAIAKARSWIDDLARGRATSFADIAEREGKSRTSRPVPGAPRLCIIADRLGDRRRLCPGRPHGDRTCQVAALFLG
jgi:hypothetical protein